MRKFIVYTLATVFGLGYFPKIPGTFTSFIAVIAAGYLLTLPPAVFLSRGSGSPGSRWIRRGGEVPVMT
jgi:hypothetical protein